MTITASRRTTLLLSFLKRQETAFESMAMNSDIKDWFSFAHWNVIMGLCLHGGKVTQTQAKKFISQPAYRSGYRSDAKRRALIKELVKAKLVSKTRDDDDERIIWIELTNLAATQVENYFDEMEEAIKKAAAALEQPK